MRQLGATGVTTGPQFNERGRFVALLQHLKHFAARVAITVDADANTRARADILQIGARRGFAGILRHGRRNDGSAAEEDGERGVTWFCIHDVPRWHAATCSCNRMLRIRGKSLANGPCFERKSP